MKISGLAFCATLLVATAAQGETACGLHRAASLPITRLSDGQLGVPVTLEGKEQVLALGISDPYSFLYGSYVKAAGLRIKGMPEGVEVHVGKTQSKSLAVLPEFKIGMVGGKDVHFVRLDDDPDAGPEVGELALDLLSSFDVDLDLANNRLNIFLQDHCAGQVVYWGTAYAQVPLDIDKAGHPSVAMQLDGKTVTVAFATDPGPGRMAMETAKRVFGIDEATPGLKPDATDASGAPTRYRYPFQRLTVEGVTVNNPVIYLSPKVRECRPHLHVSTREDAIEYCFGASQLTLGMEELRRLHLYFAFKEKMLYVTPASADGATDSPTPTGAPAQLGKPN